MKGVAALLLLLGLGACSRPPGLAIYPSQWHFGAIPSYHVAVKQVEVRNPTAKTVQLRFMSTCDCLRVERAPGQLAAGEAALVELSYDPAWRSGFEEAAVIVVVGRGRRETRAALRVYGKVLPAGEAGGGTR